MCQEKCMIILMERLREITEGKISKEEGGFRKGKVCMDIMKQDYIRKHENLNTTSSI